MPTACIAPTTRNPWGSTQGVNAFREFLVSFSMTFPRNYTALSTADWTLTAAGNNMGGTWTDLGSGVAIPGAVMGSAGLTTAGFPTTGDASGVQVLGLSFVNEFTMVPNP